MSVPNTTNAMRTIYLFTLFGGNFKSHHLLRIYVFAKIHKIKIFQYFCDEIFESITS